MKKLKVGVIGLGMGKGHIKGFASHPNAEVVAVADIDSERLAEVGKSYEVPERFDSGEQLIHAAPGLGLDIISVATPNKFHKPLTIAALEAGTHVFCEKPMAMNADEAREMESVAEKTGKRLMINFSFRFNEMAFALKSQVDAGRLGEVYCARSVWLRRRGLPRFGGWFGQKELSGGGPLIDLGVHRIDLALWLMGYPEPLWVLGSTYDHVATKIAREEGKDFDVEDLAMAMVKFDNGATLEAEASWAAHIRENELMETRLMGTEGGLLYCNQDQGYNFSAELFYESEGYQFNTELHPGGKKVPSPMEHLVDAILNETPHIATAHEGVIVMELLDAIYESAETGAPVKV